MNWTLSADTTASVYIPDPVLEDVLAAIDLGGEFPVDPYQDTVFAKERVGRLAQLLREAVARRHEFHRAEALKRLRLEQWQPWAQGVLDASESSDELLQVLERLVQLCEQARGMQSAIRVLAD